MQKTFRRSQIPIERQRQFQAFPDALPELALTSIILDAELVCHILDEPT